MFHTIPQGIQERMQELEELDEKDRDDGTSRLQRLRQIPPETGQFIAILAATAPEGKIVEIGTSAGYSTLWLSLAAREQKRSIITFELLEEKIKLAKETFEQTATNDIITLVEGDVLETLGEYDQIAVAFLDTEKELYAKCYEILVPKMIKGGILLADNAINHAENLKAFLERALSDERIDAMIVPVGMGVLLGRVI